MAGTGYSTKKSLFQENLERIMEQAKNDPKWVYQPSFRQGLSVAEEDTLRKLSGLEPIETGAKAYPQQKNQEAYSAYNGNGTDTSSQNVFDPTEEINRWLSMNNTGGLGDADTGIYALGNIIKKDPGAFLSPATPPLSNDLDTVIRGQNKQKAEETARIVSDFSKDNKALGAVFNLGLSLTAGTSAAADAIDQFSKSVKDKDYVPDPYTKGMLPTVLEKAAEEGVLDGLEGLGRFFAGTGLSIAQNAMRLPLGAVGLANMAVGAGGQSAQDVIERGGTTGQALTKGVLSGATEYVTEKIPFDKLMDLVRGGTKTISKSAVVEVLKQAGIEAGEEAVSEYVNTLSDMAIMGKNSEFEQFKKAKIVDEGLSEAEAEKSAMMQYFIANPLKSGLSGAISGGVMGAPAAAIGNIQTKAIGDALGQESVSELIDQGLKNDEKSDSYRMSRLAREKADKGEALTNGEIGSMYMQLSAEEEQRRIAEEEQNKQRAKGRDPGEPDIRNKPDDTALLDLLEGKGESTNRLEQRSGELMNEFKIEAEAAKINPLPVVRAVDAINKSAISRIEERFQISAADSNSKLAIDTFELVTKPDAIVTEKFVSESAGVWAGMLEKKNAPMYKALTGAEKSQAAEFGTDSPVKGTSAGKSAAAKSDIGKAITDYVINGETGITAELSETARNLIKRTSDDFKKWLSDTVFDIARVKDNVWGREDAGGRLKKDTGALREQARRIRNGDWAGALWSAPKVSTQADAEAGIDVWGAAHDYKDTVDEVSTQADAEADIDAWGAAHDYKDTVDEGLVEFADKTLNEHDTHKPDKLSHEIGVISNKAAKDIKDITGIDADGLTHAMEGNAVAHITNTGYEKADQRLNTSKSPQAVALEEYERNASAVPLKGSFSSNGNNQQLNVPFGSRSVSEQHYDHTSDGSVSHSAESINIYNEGSVVNGTEGQQAKLHGGEGRADIPAERRGNPVLKDGGRQGDDNTAGAVRKGGRRNIGRRPSAWRSGYAAYTAENPVVTKQESAVDGTGRTIRYNEVTNKEYDILKRQLSDIYGGEYVFFDGQATVYYTDKDGSMATDNVDGFTDGGKIYVTFGKDTEKIVIHEHVHNIAKSMAEAYSSFQKNILQLFSADRFYDLYTRYCDEYASLYGNMDTTAFEEAIIEEIVADAVSDALTGQMDTGLFETKEAGVEAGEYISDFAHDNLYAGTYKNTLDSGGRKKDIRFSVSKENGNSFATQVDKWLRGEMKSSEYFELGETPNVLQRLGASDIPLVMTKDIMAKITGEKHSIALDEIKKLPDTITDPIMVFKSSTHPNAFVVLTELDDKEDRRVIAAIHLDKTHKHHSVNLIASAYGRNNIVNFILNETAKGNLKYINKNKSRQWFQSARLQLPLLETATSTSTNNILTERDIVNNSMLQNTDKNTFSDKVDDILNNRYENTLSHVEIGETPDVLVKVGFNQLPLMTTVKHIKSIAQEKGDSTANYHGLGADIVKKIPEALKSPVMIVKSLTRPNDSVVLVTDLMDSSNNPIISAIMRDGKGKVNNLIIDANIMTSAYGKEKFENFIKKSVEKDGLLYFNKNKSLPAVNPGIQFPNIMPDGFVNSIRQNDDSDNSSMLQNTDKNTPESETVFSKSITYNATEIMLRAHLHEGKVYSMSEAKRVTDDIIKATIADGHGIKVSGKDAADIARVTHALLNSPNNNTRMKLAGDIAERIVEHAIIDKGSNDFEMYRELYKDLTAHRNKLDFSSADKAELKYLYDTDGARDKQLLWSGGNLPVDTLYTELSEMYPYMFPGDITNTGDQMTKIFDVFDRISDLRNQPTVYLRDVIEDETRKELSRNIAEQIAAGLEGGTDSKVRRLMDDSRVKKANLRAEIAKYKDELERTKNKASEDLRRLRREREEKLSEYRESNKEVRERESSRRRDSEARTRLMNVARRLHKMKGSPEFERLKKELIGNIDLISKGMTESGRLRLTELRNQYLAASEYMGDNFIPRKDLIAKLDRLDKTQISDMTNEEVRDLTDVLIRMEHEIKNSNKLINDEKKRNVYDTAVTVAKEISEAGGTKAKPGSIKISTYLMSQLSPKRFFMYLQGWGRGTTGGIYNMLEDGQTKMMDFQMKADKTFKPFNEKHKDIMRSWQGKNATFIDTGIERSGKPIRITPSMRISLFLHNKNVQNRRHMGFLNEKGELSGGGITIPDEGLYRKGDYANAYGKGKIVKLTPSEIASITASMTDEEREFAELAYKFFNVDSKNAINEVSLALDGYEIAMVENYFPIVSNKAFTRQEFESLLRDGRLEGLGSLKHRKEGLNPIVLEDVTSVLTRHIDNVSKYVGLAIPIRNFNKVFNTTFLDYEGSVKNTIGKVWGDFALKYIEKLMSDLQFPNKQRTAFDKGVEKIRGNFAKSVLSVNPGTALKQTMSLPYAASVLGWDAITHSLTAGAVDTELVDKYTPLLWYRNKGSIDSELGEIVAKQTWDKKLPWLMDWMQKIDSMTTKRIWKAAEFYVSKNNQKLQKGTEDYYKAVADKFNETVLQTQSNYSILQRPHVTRMDNEVLKAFTMFSTDRFQALNMAIQAWGEFNRAATDLKKGIGSKEAVKEAKSALASVLSGLVAGAFGTGLINFLNSLLTGYLDRYRDEEGDIKAESVIKEAMGEVAEQLLGLPLIGAEVFGFVKALITDDSYNEIQSIPIQTLTKTLKSAYGFINVKQPGSFPGAARNFVKDAAVLCGVPAGNIEKYVLGAARVINSDMKRYYDLFFSPSKKVAVNDFWGESSIADKVDELNKRITDANGHVKSAEQLTPVSLPTRFYKFTLDKQEYVLTISERIEYERELKERIERALSRINVERGSVKDVRQSVREAINTVEKELKERYAREHRR